MNNRKQDKEIENRRAAAELKGKLLIKERAERARKLRGQLFAAVPIKVISKAV